MNHTMYFVILQQGCGGTQTGSGGHVTSPGYPQNYPNNLNCTWTLTAPTGYSVKAEIIYFQLQWCCDFLKVVLITINYIYTCVNISISLCILKYIYVWN